jgi:hypothetical protein
MGVRGQVRKKKRKGGEWMWKKAIVASWCLSVPSPTKSSLPRLCELSRRPVGRLFLMQHVKKEVNNISFPADLRP